jgi:hypothetical protein
LHKLSSALVLVAAGSILISVPARAQLLPPAALSGLSAAGRPASGDAIILAGGMTGGGMTGGGMTGGGMTGGGMTGGGMTGGGMTGNGGAPAYGATGYAWGGQSSDTSQTSEDGPQPAQYYNCRTQYGYCSVQSAAGALRRGSSCRCLFGGQGIIQ